MVQAVIRRLPNSFVSHQEESMAGEVIVNGVY
jgi:hypothetical protein